MTNEQFNDLEALGAHITLYCSTIERFRLMAESMEMRADILRRRGITNPMPGLEKELDGVWKAVQLERFQIDSCLASLGMGQLPEGLDEYHLENESS